MTQRVLYSANVAHATKLQKSERKKERTFNYEKLVLSSSSIIFQLISLD